MKVLQAIGEYLVIEVLEAKEEGLQLDMPDRYKGHPYRGKIRSIGIAVKMFLKHNDIVIFKYFHGQPITIPDEPDKKFIIIHQENIIALEKESINE